MDVLDRWQAASGVKEIREIVHATTVATNAVLEGNHRAAGPGDDQLDFATCWRLGVTSGATCTTSSWRKPPGL